MLDAALKFLSKEFNTYLLARTGSNFGEAELSRLVDEGGKWAIKEDHIGVSLINLEEERTLKSQLPEATYVGGRQIMFEPALKLNLCVLFAAYFKQYDQALRQLAHVLTFFQAHPTFTPEQYAGLDPQISRLNVELVTLNYEQLNQIWAYVGGKYLSSALYRVRMVALQDAEPASIQVPVTTINGEIRAA